MKSLYESKEAGKPASQQFKCRLLSFEGNLSVLQNTEFVAADLFQKLRIVEHFHEAVDGCVAGFFGDADREIDE